MSYIDTHCHLTYKGVYEKIEEVLESAKQNKIDYLHTISTNKEDAIKILNVLEKYGDIYNIYGSVGVHPCDAIKGEFMTSDEIIDFISLNKRFISIGETGLDKYHDSSKESLKKQYKSFEEHIKASLHCDMPLVIHSRDAELDTISILSKYPVKGILHCFTGSLDFVKKCLDLGLYISFSGIITFAKEYDDIVKYVPNDRIIVETDSPYLTPKPYRGRKNQPSYVRFVYDRVLELKQDITIEDLLNNGINVLNLNKL